MTMGPGPVRSDVAAPQKHNDAAQLVRDLRAEIDAAARLEGAGVEPELHDYDIVIPIFNARSLLEACLESVLQHTHHRHRLFLIDDASTDPQMQPWLTEFAAQHAHVSYERLPKNRGFPGAVNAGFQRTTRDVVLLNSDTEVTPQWLTRMDRCRRSDPRIHIVSPLSNNATICSVPQMNRNNALPEGLCPADVAQIVRRTALRRYPRTPTAVGFCMLMTRVALDKLGGFDVAFGRGYGEEVDWCQRAWGHGFETAICDDAYVHHHGEASYSEVAEKRTLQIHNDRLVARRWPDYHSSVASYCLLNPLRVQHQKIFQRMRQRRYDHNPPSVLHVAHSWDALGGTELHTKSLVERTQDRFQTSVLSPEVLPGWFDATVSDTDSGPMDIRMNRRLVRETQFIRGAPTSLRSRMVERFFAEVMAGLDPDIVHFQHLLFYGSFLLPQISREWGAKVVISLHDYFFMCPDWNLLGTDGRLCGKDEVADQPDCLACLESKRQSTNPAAWFDLRSWTADRQRLVRDALQAAHLIVAPSQFVGDQFAITFGASLAKRVEVLPHGTQPAAAAPRRPYSGPLRVAFLGHLAPTKGRDVLVRAAQRLRRFDVRLKVLGSAGADGLPPGLDNLEFYGPYQPEELPSLLHQVDVVLILSVWHETYCLTLDEALRVGVPVIATRVGAIQERVVDQQTGILVDPDDDEALANALLHLDRHREVLAELRRNIEARRFKSIDENVAEYVRCYERLLASTTPKVDAEDAQAINEAEPASIAAGISDIVRKRMRRNAARLASPPQSPPSRTAGVAKLPVTTVSAEQP